MRIKKSNFNMVVALGGVILGIAVVALLCPVARSEASAEDEATTTAQVLARSVISISMPEAIDVDIAPTAEGVFNYINTNLQVSTNNMSGYELLINSVDTTNMVAADKSNSSVISTLATEMTPGEFVNNTWGYYFGESEPTATSTYSPMTVEGARLYYTDAASTVNNYNLAFGAKIDTTLPAGSYTNAVVISTVANPTTITNLKQLTYMQEMTSEICENSAVNATKQLIDTRDGKTYWVAKLKDGNCWMTQNLALDLDVMPGTNVAAAVSTTGVKTEIDNRNTDIEGTSWTPNDASRFKTNAVELNGVKGDNATFTNQFSWNAGKVVLATPLTAKSCNTYGTYLSAKSGDDLGEICKDFGFVDVLGEEWQPTFAAQAGTYNGETQPLVAVDKESKTYDAHYLIGNYYQWNTVTAGTGVGLKEKNAVASGSICPKGWMLPAGGTNDNNKPIVNPNQDKASFYQLSVAYGYPETDEYAKSSVDILYPSANVESNLAAGPVYLARSGYTSLSAGYFENMGLSSIYWSSTLGTINVNTGNFDGAFVLAFNNTTASFGNSQTGFEVGRLARCVAR